MKLAAFFTGPYTKSLLDAIRQAESHPDDGGPYELRVLRAPAVYLYAVWLHRESAPSADRLFVAAPAPLKMDTSHAFTEQELVNGLQPLVTAAFDSTHQV
jgi:hypothetical protein